MQKFRYTGYQKSESVLDFLLRRFAYKGADAWEQSIVSGAILVNGRHVASEKILQNKDEISYTRQRSDEPVIDERYKILYQDEYILVVEKNGNIPISESGKYYKNTLLNILKEKEGYPELYAVHRLDRETSGLVLIARTKDTAALIGKQFQFRKPEKEYHAVLFGEMEQNEIMLESPIRKVSPLKDVVRIRQVVSADGKYSKTQFTKIKIESGLTLVKIRLFTGRTHQIRCHAEYLGFPVLGDKLYGQKDEFFIAVMSGEKPPVFGKFGLIERHLLHASFLSFNHPKFQRLMKFNSEFEKPFLESNITSSLITA